MRPTSRQPSRRNAPRDRETLRAELDELLENPAIRPPDWLTKLGATEALKAPAARKAPAVSKASVAPIPTAADQSRASGGLRTAVAPSKRVKEIVDVQNGLTLAQAAVLRTMFEHGVPVENGIAPFRVCTKGLSELADLAHVGRDALRHKMLPALREKGCIWEVGRYDSDTRRPRSYLVIDFLTIKTMWAASGIHHFIPGRTPQLCGPDGSPRSFSAPADFDPLAYVRHTEVPEATEALRADADTRALITGEALIATEALAPGTVTAIAIQNEEALAQSGSNKRDDTARDYQSALIEKHRIDGQIRLRRVVTDQQIDPVWREWAKKLLDQGTLACETNPARAAAEGREVR